MTIALPNFAPLLRPSLLPPAVVPGLYVHVPFCFHKCHYCDFYSITRQDRGRMENFVKLLLDEAAFWDSSNGKSPGVRPRTIFFGGGTPSLLPADLMRRLIDGLRARFDLSELEEFTVEANPATVSDEYCAMLRDAGVDRISFGAQSFDRRELATLERHHDPEDVPRSLDIARRAGFRRINFDLIYAIPGQDLASWSASLEQAIALGTTHLSAYNLTYEPNTAIAVKKRLGQLVPIEESLELQMLHHTRRRMNEAGLRAYEISNYATPGQECRHNLLYWNGGSYIGLGPSAASHVEGHRWKNRPHLGEWEDAVGRGEVPTTEFETLSPGQRAGELAMLQLRLADGVDFDAFQSRTGLDPRQLFADPLDRFGRQGLLDVSALGVRLTERGVNVADALAGEFLQAASAQGR